MLEPCRKVRPVVGVVQRGADQGHGHAETVRVDPLGTDDLKSVLQSGPHILLLLMSNDPKRVRSM